MRRDFGRPSKMTAVLAGLAVLYLVLGLVAFFTGGFSMRLGAFTVSATAPQKMVRIALGIAVLAGLMHAVSRVTLASARGLGARYWTLAVGFCAGYLPVLLYSLFVEPARAPARVANLARLADAAPDIIGNIIPILSGFKAATTQRLAVPLVAAIPGAAALAAYLWINRRRVGRIFLLSSNDASIARDFFPLLVVFVPLLFLVSGAYVDTQSYRYLIPMYVGVCVAWAAGALALAKRRTALAGVIVAAVAAIHGWQQLLWFQTLSPDAQSLATIDCLKRDGIRGGYADYWTSYKLTFLSKEEIIIAPINGLDRYPRYTDYVRSLDPRERLNDVARCGWKPEARTSRPD
jgi:hypothetical protein